MPYADRAKRIAASAARYAAHRDEDKERRKADYYASDPKAERAKRRAWYEANRDKALALERARQYKIRYGITIADYDSMLAAQGGCCAICKLTTPSKRKKLGERYYHSAFAVDHDHTTGKVRGLLCAGCNVALGKIEGWYVKHRREIDAYLTRGSNE